MGTESLKLLHLVYVQRAVASLLLLGGQDIQGCKRLKMKNEEKQREIGYKWQK